MIYEQLHFNNLPNTESTECPLQSYQQVFRVNLTALQEKVSAIVTCVTCGVKSQELSAKLNRVGLSAKIRPVCLQEAINGFSAEFLPTLPRWGITLDGEFGELAMSAPRTSETEFSFWRTPTASGGEFSSRNNKSLSERWITQKQKHLSEQVAYLETFPTPTAMDGERTKLSNSALANHLLKRGGKTNLAEHIALFPTPTVFGNNNRKGASKKAGNGLATIVGGKLNPTWVEWLMGFPLGWTDLDV